MFLNEVSRERTFFAEEFDEASPRPIGEQIPVYGLYQELDVDLNL